MKQGPYAPASLDKASTLWTTFPLLSSIRQRWFYDYTPAAFAWWCCLIGLSAWVVVWMAPWVASLTVHDALMAAACVVAAVVASIWSIAIPRTYAFIGGEVLLSVSLILFGPEAATLTVLAECMIGGYRKNARFTSYVATFGIQGTSVMLMGVTYQSLKATFPAVPVGELVLCIASLCVFFAVSLALSPISKWLKEPRAHRGGLAEMVVEFAKAYRWSIVATYGATFVGAMLALAFKLHGIHTLLATSGLIAGVLSCLHYWTRLEAAKVRHVEELSRVAYQDALTGLHNRRAFTDKLGEVVHGDAPFALYFIDSDRFKAINDTHGHDVGDAFLKHVASVLHAEVRDTDFVVRLGGDEFAVIAFSSAPDSEVIAQRIVDRMRVPVRVLGRDVMSTVSIGVTHSTQGSRDPTELLADADIAMFSAKTAGRNRTVTFDPGMRASVQRQKALELHLPNALAKREIHLVYQPIFSLKDRTLLGFEALCRWHCEALGPVSPAEFIPLAETTSFIPLITRFAIEEAIAKLEAWQALADGTEALSMHVNISALDLADPRLIEFVRHTLQAHRVAAGSLVLEITETALMKDFASARSMVDSLRALGVGIAIDDFGVGESSLSRLASLSFSSLKIDGSFVKGLKPGQPQEIVRLIVALATSLKREVVAECVETEAQLSLLLETGCKAAQGYLYSKPLTDTHAASLLSTCKLATSHRADPIDSAYSLTLANA